MAQRIGCRLGARDNANLAEDVTEMDLDRIDANIKLEGNLLIGGTSHDETQNFTLTLTDLDIVRHGGTIWCLGVVQNRPVALDSLLPLPAVGRKEFVEGEAIHTSRKSVKLIRTIPYALIMIA